MDTNTSFQASLDQSISEALNFERSNLELFIEHYFGSVERAKEVIKYYVIEEEPIRMEVDERIGDIQANFRFTHTYRIRPKTAEELHHDRADAIVAKHTAPQCIVCHEPVNPDDFVDTRHGAYHEWCVDGHA